MLDKKISYIYKVEPMELIKLVQKDLVSNSSTEEKVSFSSIYYCDDYVGVSFYVNGTDLHEYIITNTEVKKVLEDHKKETCPLLTKKLKVMMVEKFNIDYTKDWLI